MKRKSFKDSTCPVGRALDAIGDWWSLLIVRDAFDGITRFSDFQKSLGIAKNILSERLRVLVEHGIFEVTPASDGGAFQKYVLTGKGHDLFHVIVGLRQWGEAHYFKPKAKHSILIDLKNEHPVRALELKSKDGKILKFSDVMVKKV